MKRYYHIVPIITLCALPALIGLLHSGFFSSDDGNWMVIRFSAFYDMVRHGQFPVRFLMPLNHGYGYPVADFLYPLFMYIGVPIKAVGFSFLSTIKILFALSFIFSGIFTFAWLRRLFSSMPSLIGALCYLYFPYHLYDMYTRGSLGEIVALAIVPFIFWQISRKDILLSALGIGFLILAHNTLALLFLPVLIGYMLVEKWEKKPIIFSVLIGLGLSCFFWLPAIVDQQYTVFSKIAVSSVADYFISLKTISLYGYISLFTIIAGVILWQKTKNIYAGFFLLVIFIAGMLSFSLSQSVWSILPLGRLVQFPFRFLSLIIPAISFLIAYEVSSIAIQRRNMFVIFSFLLIFYSAQIYIYPHSFQDYPDTWYSTNQDTTTIKNEYMPLWVKHIPTESSQEKVVISKGKGTIENLLIKGSSISFMTTLATQSTIHINIIYFPGWEVLANGKQQTISYTNNQGIISFSLPKGQYTIVSRFGETPIRLLADAVSVISFGVFGIWYLVYSRKGKK